MQPASMFKTRLMLLGSVVAIVAACSIQTQAQRPGSAARDAVRAIQQKEMDQLLLLQTLPAKPADNSARLIAVRQIAEDFKELQTTNNKMMAEAWSRQTLHYGFLSEMISHIRAKASRLKLNLNLPQPKAGDKPVSAAAISTADEFRAALLLLDRTVMRFVSNPMFQRPNTIEVKHGTDARRDLEIIIGFADDLKKTAIRLSKVEHSQ